MPKTASTALTFSRPIALAIALGFSIAFSFPLVTTPDSRAMSALIALMGLVIGALVYFDLTDLRLPDMLTLPLLGAGLLHAHLIEHTVLQAGIGALIGYGIVAGLNAFWVRHRGAEGMGRGDGKLLAACGAWFGPLALAPILLVASSAALLCVLAISAIKHNKPVPAALPYGPFILIGFVLAWHWPVFFFAV